MIPKTSDQDREEAKKNGIKGGVNSGKARRQKRNIREAFQALLNSTYDLKDKSTGKVMTLTGEEAIALSIARTAMNPKDKNWSRAVEYALRLDGSNISPEDKKKSKEEIKLIQAKIKQVQALSKSEDITEIEGDGFIEALNGTAASDWSEDASKLEDSVSEVDAE